MNYDELVSNGRPQLRSRLKGDFEGFENEKLFHLENGQCWMQKKFDYWNHFSFIPFVVIYAYGRSHFLTINGKEKFVEVELVKGAI